MTYQARIGADGSLAISSDQLAAAGFTPGDLVTIEQCEGRPTSNVEAGRFDEALSRLRETMRGYSVDRFLKERRADWSE